ncbi:DUF1253-domain-containing protein [Aaosphaeria arxii CBS 175.79]|uniref:U3 small nucleolar RNA-associated protein 25 n=1 Tax=Aaosphaeria arxii CBS 175.79 TaxID=1450172 RepID=A0A6A5XLE0_9PLEO|nr:DUF1253-domain-containing protein [Aaosphaeria arxii CBS 175.79]KAF2013962.1 DUF1253-domain-containing protein [Aaosphaeria arxii CBS 175.79]
MAPFRGRGTRGGFRGRGGGRGRGGRGGRGGRNNGRDTRRGFVATKLEDVDANGTEDAPNFSEEESDSAQSSDESSEEEEEEGQTSSQAYQALLRSYQSNAPKDKPRRKRQKLEHHAAESDEEAQFESSDYESADTDQDDDDAADAIEQVDAEAESSDTDDDDATKQDPFLRHFANPDEKELSQQLQAIAQNKWASERLSSAGGGRCMVQYPDFGGKAPSRPKLRAPKDISLKPRLAAKAQDVIGEFTTLEQAIAPSIFEYQDVLFGARTAENADRLRSMTCLHALNHIFKTRDRVIKNNDKLARMADDTEAEFRDQGFTRPKVLFLLETKQACVRAVDAMTKICDFEQQENKKRFMDTFFLPEDKFGEDRPADYRELFEGNDENEFRIGMKFTRKTVKLFSKFYNSDIIFASALGLRRAIESGDPKKKDFDFLSSIEVVIMEQADATLMQNWEHAEYVFEHLNLQPKDAHDCDFSRVRSWYLDGHAPNLRQTVVLSAYLTPKINTLYNKHMKNVGGRLKYTADYTDGAIETINYSVKQTFSRFESPNHVSDPDARFKYFSSTLLPQITRLPKPVEGGLGVLVFIPSYLDFVRVRNSLVDSDFSYASISEYTDATNVRKARSHFMSGRHSVLLYTGRAHHFHRYRIRGVKRVIFYGVPENPHFYTEVVGFVGSSLERGEVSKVETSVRVAFSKWERLELERIVGTKRVGKFVSDKGDIFDFV